MYGFIYLTTNNINNKKYIGQKFYDKNGKWKLYLGSGIALKNAIKKYGSENFSRVILEECETKQDLDNKEKYWIEFYNATKNNSFYNIATGGDGGNVIKGFSPQRLQRLKNLHSKRSKEYVPNGENGYVAKLKEFEVEEIIDMLLKNKISIASMARKFKVSTSTITDIRDYKTWLHMTKEKNIKFPKYIKKLKKLNKPVIQYDLNGNIICKYISAREAADKTGIGYKLISAVCNGHKKTTHGYVFRLESDEFGKYTIINDNFIKVYKYKLNGEFVDEFNSIKDAQDSIGGFRIDHAIKSKSHISHGFKWYKEKPN